MEKENKTSKAWSVYFQNPEYLERTRMFMIPREMHPLVRQWCGLEDGMRILDVGCGTGYFTRLLAGGEQRVSAVGLDIEEPFIKYAQTLADAEGLPIEFVTGDALNLPFADGSFDLVVSHTFLTSVSDPAKALGEMKRVIRPGGKIASVTPMNFCPSVYGGGKYPEDCAWHREFDAAYQTMYQAYFKIDSLAPRMAGLKPREVPGFFAEHGLRQVCAYPLGKVFSLSNAAVPAREKQKYLELYEASELKKLDAFMQLPESAQYITREDAERFRRLIREKCDWYREHPEENAIWDWQGDANVLVTGVTCVTGEPHEEAGAV